MGSVSFQGSVYTSWGTQTTDVIVNYSENYNVSANKTTVSVTSVQLRVQGGTNWGTQVIKGSVAINGVTVCSFSPGTSAATQINVTGSYTTLPGSSGSAEVRHNDDGTGSFTLSLEQATGGDIGGIFGFWYGPLGTKIGVETPVCRTVGLTARPRASAIASCPASLATLDTLELTVNRGSSAFYHKATFSAGGLTLYTSGAFAASLSYTVPRSWFSAFPTAASLAVTVSVQTYSDVSCTASVGSPATANITVAADAGMAPAVSAGWVSLSPYNTGAAAAVSGYVKGYSQAQASFDAAKISLADTAGAAIRSYSVTCQGATSSQGPYLTPVLSSASVAVTCTVTDSRGRSASETVTLRVMEYAKPSLSGVSVFRCTESGTASEAGTYYSVRASVLFSSLDGWNSCSLSASLAVSGGAYGSETALSDGSTRVLGPISADASYTVRLKAEDRLGNTAVYYQTLPTRKWAMKFRPNGEGVAFGKAAEHDRTFEINPDWAVKIGGHDVSRKYVSVFNDGDIEASEQVTVNDLAAAGNAVALIRSDTDRPPGSSGWFHALSLCWSKGFRSFISQLAFGTNNSDGLWYRTASQSVVGAAWKRVFDSGTTIPVANGGTGAASAAGARDSLHVGSELIWTNPSPAAEFPAQTISLSLTGYSAVRVVFLPFASTSQQGVAQCPVGTSSSLFYMEFDVNNASSSAVFLNGVSRLFSVSDTGISFQNGQMIYAGGAYKDWNTRAIPYKIYAVRW